MDNQIQKSEVLPAIIGQPLNLISNQSVKVRETKEVNCDIVPHISRSDVGFIAAAADTGKYGPRNRLLIQTIFDGALRVSECLGVTPRQLKQTKDGYFIQDVKGKSYKGHARIGDVAISSSLYNLLRAYCADRIGPNERIFPFSKTRAFQIVQRAMKDSLIVKPAHVGAVHVLRHSGCIERLRETGNPKAVQDHLRHKNIGMTVRYMKTLSVEESLKINMGVDFKW